VLAAGRSIAASSPSRRDRSESRYRQARSIPHGGGAEKIRRSAKDSAEADQREAEGALGQVGRDAASRWRDGETARQRNGRSVVPRYTCSGASREPVSLIRRCPNTCDA